MGRLFLFDGTALAYRAFYALDRALSTSSGIPTNATYGVAKMLVRFIKDHVKEGEDYLAFAFDKKTITYRHTLLETYKAKRPKTPDLMLQQLSATSLHKETCERYGDQGDRTRRIRSG